MTQTLAVSVLASPGTGAGASDVTVPIAELKVHLQNWLNGLQLGEIMWMLEQGTSPSAPTALTGQWKLYFKAGGLFFIDDAGVEYQVSTSGGGGSSDPFNPTRNQMFGR